MDSAISTSGSTRPHDALQASRLRWIAVAIAGILYGVLLATHMGAWAGGADSSGYLNNARLLREGRIRVDQRTIEGLPSKEVSHFTYVPLGFIPKGTEQMVPTYPVGLSLLIAAVSPFTGWGAASHVTQWLQAMAGVALVFALARAAGLGPIAGLWGALILAASPLYVMMSLQTMSDMPALVWCTAAVLCAWFSQKRARWAFAAGWCVAIAVLVRPSNLLIVAPVALCLGFNWRSWLWLIAGGLPGAAFQALLNFNLYGSPFASGYGSVGGIFSWNHLPLSLASYGRWLPVILTPGMFLIFGLPWLLRRESGRLIAVLATWTIIFPAFYAFYLHTHEDWWYLRFLMPSFPPAIILTLLVARTAIARWPAGVLRVAGWATATLVVLWGVYWGDQKRILSVGRGERIFRDVAIWADVHLPPNAVITAMQTSGALFHYTKRTIVRWDQFDPAKFAVIERACAAAGRPIFAVLYPFEIPEMLEQRLPGRWTQVGAVEYATIWRRDGSEPSNAPLIPWTPLAAGRVGDMEVSANGVAGWSSAEHDHKHRWAWSSQRSEVDVNGTPRHSQSVQLDFSLRSLAPCTVTVKQNETVLWRGAVGVKRSAVKIVVPLVEGRARLDFSSDSPGVRETPEDPSSRLLAFAVYDARLSPPKSE
jgi:hypothetical protein